jgi:hypothetical protein
VVGDDPVDGRRGSVRLPERHLVQRRLRHASLLLPQLQPRVVCLPELLDFLQII